MNETNTPLHITKPPRIDDTEREKEYKRRAAEFEKHIIETEQRVGYIEYNDLDWTYERKGTMPAYGWRSQFATVVNNLRARSRVVRVFRPDDPSDNDGFTYFVTEYICSPEHVAKMVFPND